MITAVSVLLALGIAAFPAVPPPPTPPVPSVGQQSTAPSPENPLDVNEATAEQLQEVPGIGATLARRIIEFREEHGAFEKVDDLLNVQGIGPTSLERIRPYLKVEEGGGGT